MKVAFIVLLGVVAALAAPSDDLSLRIVGGEEASDGQFPYQVSLVYYGDYICGGSILDYTTILSSAACVEGRTPALMTVVVGTNKLDQGGDEYDVSYIIQHEYYNEDLMTNDISIIKLETPIQYNKKVQPVELRTKFITGGEECTLSGWGTTIKNGKVSNNLQFIKLTTLSIEDCIEKQQSGIEVNEKEVCTLTKIGEGACNGDAGSPLVDSERRLIGIFSWGTPCARGQPDVYTRISSFLEWIEKNRVNEEYNKNTLT